MRSTSLPVASRLWLFRQALAQWMERAAHRARMVELMPRLGYQRYAAQGGDWGSAVTTCIGDQDPANCIGIHLNMPIARPDPATANDMTEKEKSAVAGMQYYNDWDSGYSKEQSTRPQTVGYGLTDSPSGQLAGYWKNSGPGPIATVIRRTC